MSWYAAAWAEKAPVADVYERALITFLGHRVSADGCGAWPSVETMAEFACCDVRSVQRRLRSLSERRLIADGDQSVVSHLDPRRRPKVYDILVPYSFYSATQWEDVNRERTRQGLDPLRPEDRPDIEPPESKGRAKRSDIGKPRKPQTAGDELPPEDPETSQAVAGDTPDLREGLTVTPNSGVTVSPEAPGVTNSPALGCLTVPGRGDYETPKTPLEKLPLETSPGGTPNGPSPARDTADDAPPPQKLPERKPERGKPETWKCSKHLAAPDPSDAPCRECRDVRVRCERREAELAAEQAAAVEAARQAAAAAAGQCTWCDGRSVIDPSDGAPFDPAVRCDHETTTPEFAAAVVAQARTVAVAPLAVAGREQARRIFQPRTTPTAAAKPRRRGTRTRTFVDDTRGTSGVGEQAQERAS